MDAEATVRAYYETLREGDSLYPFFARAASTVKFGVGERLTGYEEISEGLREQTATTDWWTVESDDLVVEERGEHAWFSDDVFMAWTDLDDEVRHEFDTRWSGTLERRTDEAWAGDGGAVTPWRFVGMHVSAPVEPATNDSPDRRLGTGGSDGGGSR